jgi:hypothetical protein
MGPKGSRTHQQSPPGLQNIEAWQLMHVFCINEIIAVLIRVIYGGVSSRG